MEGSRLSSGRSSGWKNSIMKKNSQESRIVSDSKEFPSKFSPSKNLEPQVKTFGRSSILSQSHDEIVVSRGKSQSRDSKFKPKV